MYVCMYFYVQLSDNLYMLSQHALVLLTYYLDPSWWRGNLTPFIVIEFFIFLQLKVTVLFIYVKYKIFSYLILLLSTFSISDWVKHYFSSKSGGILFCTGHSPEAPFLKSGGYEPTYIPPSRFRRAGTLWVWEGQNLERGTFGHINFVWGPVGTFMKVFILINTSKASERFRVRFSCLRN